MSSAHCLSKRLPSRKRRGAIVVLGLSVAACAHNVVYDEHRDQQAQAAQKAVNEAHVASTVTELDKAFGEVAAREEAAARQRQEELFKLEVRIVAQAGSLDSEFDTNGHVDGLITMLRTRLERLGLSSPVDAHVTAVRMSAVTSSAAVQDRDLSFTEFYGAVGYRFHDCIDVYAVSADPIQESPEPAQRFLNGIAESRRAAAKAKFQELMEKCHNVDQAVEEQKALYQGGSIGALITRAAAIEHELLAYDAKRQKAQAAIDSAVEQFKTSGAQAATAPGASGLQSLQERAESLRQTLAAIGQAGGAPAEHAVAAERLQRLESLLAAIAGNPEHGKLPLSQEEKASVAIVRGLPALADEADKMLAEAAKPRLVPFLAAIDYQKLALKGLEAGRDAKLKQAAAVRNQMQAALNESLALARVLDALLREPSWAGQSIGNLNSNLPAAKKRSLHRALAIYADDVPRYRIDQAVWAVRERTALYEEGLERSKFIAAQWDGLLDAIARVLADYHATGIKQADIAEFFKAFGLVTIGVGVAQ